MSSCAGRGGDPAHLVGLARLLVVARMGHHVPLAFAWSDLVSAVLALSS